MFQFNWGNLKFGFNQRVKIILLFMYLRGWSGPLFCRQSLRNSCIHFDEITQSVFIQFQIIGINATAIDPRVSGKKLLLLILFTKRDETAFWSVELTFGNSQCSVQVSYLQSQVVFRFLKTYGTKHDTVYKIHQM